jgi:hypothetical protein
VFAFERTKYGKMAAYSGLGINDLGYYEGCQDISIAKYVLLIPQDKATLAF